jgi:hypothetical protein
MGELKFAPSPENIFQAFIREYFERAKKACPRIEGISGKWEFEDLIPGMSDFDTRFFFSDETTAEEWPEISRAVGRIHTWICREYPERARILEHLPGINLGWNEAFDPLCYSPEYHQWNIYHAPLEKADRFENYLSQRPWDTSDELFNLKKFALYYTPYDREIDPPINLHEFESKYPLHSRFMHYFCPPLQSLVSLRLKKMVRGKLEAFRLAHELFPNPQVIDRALKAIDSHYEIPSWYEEPEISVIEEELFRYLQEAYRTVYPEITLIEAAPADNSQELKKKLGNAQVRVLDTLFDGIKFSRLMMGRLYFYAEEIPHFESLWLIRNELGRDRRMLYENTFSAFGFIVWGERLSPDDALERCRSEFLSSSEICDVRSYAESFGKSYDDSSIKRLAADIANTMGPFQVVLEKLGAIGRRIAREKGIR